MAPPHPTLSLRGYLNVYSRARLPSVPHQPSRTCIYTDKIVRYYRKKLQSQSLRISLRLLDLVRKLRKSTYSFPLYLNYSTIMYFILYYFFSFFILSFSFTVFLIISFVFTHIRQEQRRILPGGEALSSYFLTLFAN